MSPPCPRAHWSRPRARGHRGGPDCGRTSPSPNRSDPSAEIRKSVWNGDLKTGAGTLTTGSGALVDRTYNFASRFEGGTATNPEELIAAAHAGCFSMALANMLAQAGHVATSVKTTASVFLGKDDKGFKITHIDLDCTGELPGIDQATFQEDAEKAKTGGETRVASAERLRDAVIQALSKMHAILDDERR